ncbi:hypothetical protein DEU56DRAFT_831969 [Suillus clintonianus]|uniref:uncharacterized protein n=1 Tax=Suillus clintonianus TaxID=1904413 RepID=UPI001B87970B|nr:uncharacterized protein DEU56DRAFT_831969 [Suillus clintonianus]KAG2122476.1 hypothetical protein DEU56DRAFT_831969 [Suillus clintonianus]
MMLYEFGVACAHLLLVREVSAMLAPGATAQLETRPIKRRYTSEPKKIQQLLHSSGPTVWTDYRSSISTVKRRA